MNIEDLAEEVSREADNVDNLLHAMKMPLDPRVHMGMLEDSLTRLRDRLRSLHIEASGNNPWEDQG